MIMAEAKPPDQGSADKDLAPGAGLSRRMGIDTAPRRAITPTRKVSILIVIELSIGHPSGMPPKLAEFYNRTRSARKIIVVDLGFLGDTVHLVPVLWDIKRNYPQAGLQVLTTPVGRAVLALLPCVDGCWTMERASHKSSLREQLRLVRALRRERFDVAFNFSGADRAIFMTRLIGARWRVAHAAGCRHFYNRWLIPCWVARQDIELPVYEQRRRVLAACGCALGPARFDLKIPDEAKRWAEATVPTGAVHFSINTSNHLKEWPLANWIELMQRLGRGGGNVQMVATGSDNPRERSRLEALASALDSMRPQTFAGLAVSRLAALLTRCTLHVGADSGVLHLARALGIPTVSLFREYPAAREWLPSGPQDRYLTVPCPCVGQKRAACLDRPTAECLAALAPEKVEGVVREQLTMRRVA